MKKLLTILCLVLLFSYSTEVFSSQPNQEDCDILCQLGLSESTQTQIKEPQTKKTKTPTEDLPEFQYKVPSHLLIKNGGMTFEQGFRDPFTGVSIKYHENGQPEEKIYYKNGREVSTTKLSYNKNDQLEELGNYKNGVAKAAATKKIMGGSSCGLTYTRSPCPTRAGTQSRFTALTLIMTRCPQMWAKVQNDRHSRMKIFPFRRRE